MKKVTIATTLLTCLLSSPFSRAADMTVNFTGNIIDSTCTIATPDIQVPLGDHERRIFKTVGGTAPGRSFSVMLADCPTVITSATFLFEGNADSTDENYLALTDEDGVATGIAIRIQQGSQVIPINTETTVPSVANNGTPRSISANFFAYYVSTSTDVKPGKANATATITVIYQ
ncbi:type 1 fimbrial protein [Enterobacter bugandensis]|nr:type 1 fimbrial protein [Enterobacter bugandensis]